MLLGGVARHERGQREERDVAVEQRPRQDERRDSEYIVMFELTGSMRTDVPPDHITASSTRRPTTSPPQPDRRKNTHSAIEDERALIAAAPSIGPADTPSTRTGPARR